MLLCVQFFFLFFFFKQKTAYEMRISDWSSDVCSSDLDGPVALMVVECTADLSIRATATLREGHAPPKTGTLQSLLNHNETGRFTVILDPGADRKSVV